MAEGKKEATQQKENDDILLRILSGREVVDKVRTKRGNFSIKYPLPYDLRSIEVTLAKRISGMPEESFDRNQMGEFRAYAVLDHVVVDAPEWWMNLESSEFCPDYDLITKLYRRYLQLRKKIQRKITDSTFRGDDRELIAADEDETLGD